LCEGGVRGKIFIPPVLEASVNEAEVRGHLIAVLTEIQEECARDALGLSDQTVPLEDLAGFDSLSCVDAEARLSERLGSEIDIPFKDPQSGEPLSVRQMAESLVNSKRPREARAR
jgi:catalase (peroxidase I)